MSLSKAEGCAISPENAQGLITSIFHGVPETRRARYIQVILASIAGLIRAMEENKGVHLYGSSLVIIYEQDENTPDKVCVRLVDFAHWHYGTDVDTNTLSALDKLKQLISKVGTAPSSA